MAAPRTSPVAYTTRPRVSDARSAAVVVNVTEPDTTLVVHFLTVFLPFLPF